MCRHLSRLPSQGSAGIKSPANRVPPAAPIVLPIEASRCFFFCVEYGAVSAAGDVLSVCYIVFLSLLRALLLCYAVLDFVQYVGHSAVPEFRRFTSALNQW